MNLLYSLKKWLLIPMLLLVSSIASVAQLPNPATLYMDQYTWINGLQSTREIYNFDPTQPSSATNPTLNTILLPTTQSYGLTVSPVLGSNNPTYTFYTVSENKYWYYDPVTQVWVNTGHLTGGPVTTIGGLNIDVANNIAAGGGFIYNLDPGNGNIYKYDGTGNGTLLVTIPDFYDSRPADLIADCEGNFYVLNIYGNYMTDSTFFRKYNSAGTLIQSWSVYVPLNITNKLIDGFGVVGSAVFVNLFDQGTSTEKIAYGTINDTSIVFNNETGVIAPLAPNGEHISDFGSYPKDYVPSVISIDIAASATTIAAGTNVTFTSTITTGLNDPKYQWFVNGIAIQGATNAIYSYQPADGDVITCTLSNFSVCTGTVNDISNPIKIRVVTCDSVQLNYQHKFFCKEAGQIDPQFSPEDANAIFYANPPGLSLNSNTGAVDLGLSDTGTFVITYFIPANAVCQDRMQSDTIRILPTPEAHIRLISGAEKLCKNDSFVFYTNQQQGYTYQWGPPDYFNSTSKAATATAFITGNSPIYLNVVDSNGCQAFDSLKLNIEDCCNISIPTAFSPNNDGLNEVFKIYSRATQHINSFSVYNRYGERVFTSSSQSPNWDGSYKGKLCDMGVYYYHISYDCSNGKTIEKKGDITLIR